MAVQYETELYSPVKAFFEQRGFEVKAEVKHCDLVGVRADQDEPLIVEMKKTFNLSLLLQGMQRLKLSPLVYLAVERNRSKRGAVNQRWGELTALCSQLGLGLITVTFYKTKAPLIDVLCEPAVITSLGRSVPSARRSGIRRQRLLKEFDERSGDYNTGGSTGRQLMTAYREKAIRVATALRSSGESSPAALARLTGVGTAAAILQKNYYGWFERLSRGKYILTVKGVEAITEHTLMIQNQGRAASDEHIWNVHTEITYTDPDTAAEHSLDELAQIAEVSEHYLLNRTKE
ncbi:DUF2161 domain-containing phosphodiesterase [Paenibacillus silvae]|uniref:DUF2161 domain-containing phosphodiesterase n=1 Tax=Paenibacillus silvae TaxID=1325358 RepID=UPI0011A29D7D|nr:MULTISPECIES: DUF2161 family putative PD-(D/E)XK-type phosphodiesterase [Paenibacillus]MCK6074419.1 hypothetical protein [Paenibacillus silvae]MCK6148103.1 hypothetical protein [Paenibacillus silvae]MCK6266403.1 hypothetical protein [Paenibacillus silvae]